MSALGGGCVVVHGAGAAAGVASGATSWCLGAGSVLCAGCAVWDAQRWVLCAECGVSGAK